MSYPLSQISPRLSAELQAALSRAASDPARRSEILGNTALGLVAKSQRPQHKREAPILRALAERIAEAAMQAPQLLVPATLDDFEETLEEHDEAHGQFSEDMDVIAHADDLHDEKTAQHAARVSIAPFSWGKGATLGRTGRFKYGPTSEDVGNNISQVATLAYWQGEPHESQAITVDIAPPAGAEPMPLLALPPSELIGASSRPRGFISFGADGAITKVAVDIGFGTRLTVPGNYVAVQVGMDAPRVNANAGIMAFTASIGAFASPSVSPVFYTHYIDDLDAGEITDGTNGPPPIQRPAHASQILPILSTATGGSVLLQFYGQTGGRLLHQVIYPIGQFLLPIPLPSEVQYVVLSNNTGELANFRIPFQLAL